jgi:hypothetical protein
VTNLGDLGRTALLLLAVIGAAALVVGRPKPEAPSVGAALPTAPPSWWQPYQLPSADSVDGLLQWNGGEWQLTKPLPTFAPTAPWSDSDSYGDLRLAPKQGMTPILTKPMADDAEGDADVSVECRDLDGVYGRWSAKLTFRDGTITQVSGSGNMNQPFVSATLGHGLVVKIENGGKAIIDCYAHLVVSARSAGGAK